MTNYSEGLVKLNNVKVTPKLDIEVGRVQVALPKASGEYGHSVVSRAVKFLGLCLKINRF